MLCHGLAALGLVLATAPLTGATPGVSCFDAVAARNSASTRSVFAARKCQGGGVTWAPILGALVARRGVVTPVRRPVPGMTGDIATLDGKALFAIDEEADAARFCAHDPGLLNAIRTDYVRLNADAAALRQAMAEASPLAMECLDEDGKPPPLPPPRPLPAPPKAMASAATERLARLKALIAREPSWCFADGDLQRRAGVLRFLPGDRVVQTQRSGEPIAQGTVLWPRETSGDDRVQIVFQPSRVPGAARLFHLDVGPSGRLGETYADPQRTRLDLLPGSTCLSAH